MNTGTVLAIVILAGYLGFELFAFKKASHRMEPAYIHNLLVKADTATQLCSDIDQSLRVRFDKTLGRVTERYRQELEMENKGMDADAINRLLEDKTMAASREAENQLASGDCSSSEMKADFRRYEIYAKRSR